MKKITLYSVAAIAALISYNASASNSCSVLGVHEPNTNIYDGPTWCENTRLNEIIVRGPLSVSHTKVNGSTEVSGPIQSKYSCFKNIIIHSSYSHQKVILSQGTKVDGNIIFKGVRGKVFIDKSSKVDGHIINADIHQVK